MSNRTFEQSARATNIDGFVSAIEKSQLHVPEPRARSGDKPDFSHIEIPAAGDARRPRHDIQAAEIRDLARTMIRVLDGSRAVGDWKGDTDDETCVQGLRAMMKVRAYDERMTIAQR